MCRNSKFEYIIKVYVNVTKYNFIAPQQISAIDEVQGWEDLVVYRNTFINDIVILNTEIIRTTVRCTSSWKRTPLLLGREPGRPE